MTDSSTLADDSPPPHGAKTEPDIDLVCGHCGHAFRTPMALLTDPSAALRCPACRKAFKMNQRFAHDALDELAKRRHANPIDQVLADLGKVLRG